MSISRADNSTLGRWWWTVDRWTLAALLTLIGCGYVMMLAASPAVAVRVMGETSRSLLLAKQVVFLALAAATLVVVSLFSPRNVRRLAVLGTLGAFALTVATLAIGIETKGARRWLAIPVLGTMQPSEFLKPCFAVLTAWLLAEGKSASIRASGAARGLFVFDGRFLWPLGALFLLGMVAVVLKTQPDIGMLLVVVAVFVAQLFVAGLNLAVVGVLGAAGVAVGVGAYFLLPHVQSRVDRFLDPSSGDTFQIDKAMEAFGNGGLLGRGPGEGRVKNVLPDAHADFVFAVAGEEFGLVVCLAILLLFAFVVIRGLFRLLAEADMFTVLAASGLLAQFGLQAFVNMASSLHLIPTKGMTLPFVSYGGSSVLAIALGMGMLLALTRPPRRTGRWRVRGADLRPIVIAAGGTGGHLFPAEALASALLARRERVVLLTDARSAAFTAFAGVERHVLPGSGIAGRGALAAARSALRLGAGVVAARTLLVRLRAAAVVGFGGYPSVPPVVAALTLRDRPPIVLHEQNAVLGRANRWLATRADTVALSFAATRGVPAGARMVVVGNPVRPAIAALVGTPPPGEHGARRLLVLGGSLGARIFSELVPAAVAVLPAELRARLIVTQQCRAEDLPRVAAAYDAAGVPAELAPFFPDVAGRLALAHVVVARAGASTVAELACAGRPAILVPLPGAIDDHQTANARALAETGAAVLLPQPGLTATLLSAHLAQLLPVSIAVGHALARPDAANALADLVLARIGAQAASGSVA